MLDSIFIPRPSLDGLRKMNRRVGFIGTPEFDRILDDLFKDIDMEKILRKHLQPVDRPKVSVKIDDDVETNQKLKDDFKWKVGDDEEGLDEGDAYEDEEPANVPPSIFDMLKSGKEFKDIVPTQPKHTEIYKQAFGLDDNGDPIPLPDDEEEEGEEVKNPFVFIANRLTFLIKTKLPIIFDTSIIETGINAKVNYMSIAVDVNKTFPKIETENDLAFIMREFNGSEEIQGEINEFLKDTEYDGIWAFPSTIVRNDVKIPAIRFVIYPKRKYYSFGPAFLNRNK